jgi:hypothetical protein
MVVQPNVRNFRMTGTPRRTSRVCRAAGAADPATKALRRINVNLAQGKRMKHGAKLARLDAILEQASLSSSGSDSPRKELSIPPCSMYSRYARQS